MRLTNELRPALGFSPRMQFDGAVEGIHPVVAENLVPALREALSNVARHADASAVRVIIDVHDEVCLTVVDDGVGIPDSVVGGNGLANLTARAEKLGGSCAARRGDAGGSVVEWRVPAAQPDR